MTHVCDACQGLGRDLGWALNWLRRIDRGQAYSVPAATLRALSRRGLLGHATWRITADGRALLDAHPDVAS